MPCGNPTISGNTLRESVSHQPNRLIRRHQDAHTGRGRVDLRD